MSTKTIIVPRLEKLKIRIPARNLNKPITAIHTTSEVINPMYAKMQMEKNGILTEKEHSTNQIGGMTKFLIPRTTKENKRRKSKRQQKRNLKKLPKNQTVQNWTVKKMPLPGKKAKMML